MEHIEFVRAKNTLDEAKRLHASIRNSVVICDDASEFGNERVLVAGTNLNLERVPPTVILATQNPVAISLVWWPIISQPNVRAIWINAVGFE